MSFYIVYCKYFINNLFWSPLWWPFKGLSINWLCPPKFFELGPPSQNPNPQRICENLSSENTHLIPFDIENGIHNKKSEKSLNIIDLKTSGLAIFLAQLNFSVHYELQAFQVHNDQVQNDQVSLIKGKRPRRTICQ